MITAHDLIGLKTIADQKQAIKMLIKAGNGEAKKRLYDMSEELLDIAIDYRCEAHRIEQLSDMCKEGVRKLAMDEMLKSFGEYPARPK